MTRAVVAADQEAPEKTIANAQLRVSSRASCTKMRGGSSSAVQFTGRASNSPSDRFR
jgi:hypothetical protein